MKQGWEIKKLGEVCDFQNGFAFQSKSYKESGLPILRITNIQNDEIDTKELVYFDTKDYKVNLDRFKVYQGDLLIAMSGATTGKLGINKSETVFYLNQRVGKFIPKKYLNKAFLYYFLTTKVDESLRIAAGAAQPNLSTEQINNFEIPLPPLPEQQRIVAILDETFSAIDKAKANAEQNLKNAKELFESYLQGVFEKKGNGWEIKTLGEVSKINYGYTEKASFDEVGPKFLRITDIQENGVDWDTVPYCKCSDKDLPKYKLEKGDIVFARTGATTGKSYLIDNPPISVFASYLIRLRMNSINEFIPEFIYYFFQTKTYWDKINAGISGSAQGGFNATKLGELEFHFPKSKTEQQTIVRQLDALRTETQKLEAVYQQKIADLEELKKSILQKAFAGELRGGEPAELETDTSASSVPVAYEINDNLSKAAEPDSIKDKNLN